MINNKDYKFCDDISNFTKYKLQHPKPQRILLECGGGTGSRTFTESDDEPFQLAFVTVDTTCLNKPEVLIKFSSLVRLEKIEGAPRTVRLKYELFRACNGEEPISIGAWMFEKADTLSERLNTLEESFNFIFCESSKCLGCCNYFVKVMPIELVNSTATVSNGQMAALAQALEYFDYTNDKESIITHSKPKNIILACGQGNGGILFKETSLLLPGDIARVEIDTSFLNKPKVLIEFSSIIKLAEDIENVILKFELFRVCGDREPLTLGTWKFEITNSEELINKAFSFIFCECKALSDYCEYFVRVTPIEIDDNDNNDVTVFDARMTAIAQSSKERIHYDYYKTLDEKSNYMDCKSLRAKPRKILLECGNSTGNRTFSSASDVPFQLANVTIDTTFLCIPVVNIQFSSIVSAELESGAGGENASIQLRYELFRTCDNRTPTSLGVWEFTMTNEENDNTQTIKVIESFDFIYCDCLTRPGCCDYFVTVTAVEVLESPEILSIVTVSNGRITALAQEAIALYI